MPDSDGTNVVREGVRTQVVGNLTAAPVREETEAGKPWAHFTVASNERRRMPDGSWESLPAVYTDVSVFRSKALESALQLDKGDRVKVVGRPDVRTFTRRDGTGSAALRVNAASVEPAPLPKREGGEAATAAAAPVPDPLPEPEGAQTPISM